ncbi:MAG: hypothetical protein P8H42_09585 [Saprospiraceae bacterium]|nr:hypothetical protein [Saprospiraceae bacterium]
MEERLKEIGVEAKEMGLTAPQIKEVKELKLLGGIVVSLMKNKEITMTFREAVEALNEI